MKTACLFLLYLVTISSLFSQTFQISLQDIQLFNYKKNIDGNIIALGKTSTYNTSGNNNYCIAKFNNIGKLISIKVIGETNAVATHREKLEVFDDSTIVLSISMPMDSINQIGDTISYSKGLIIRFDNNLNVISTKQWDKTYICDMQSYNKNVMTSYVLGC